MYSKTGSVMLPVCRIFFVMLLVSQVNSQFGDDGGDDDDGGFLWSRIFPTGNPGQLPQDCVKTWGRCQYAAARRDYFQQEYVVISEKNGGTCNLNTQRFCDVSCSKRPPCSAPAQDCVKAWGRCQYAAATRDYFQQEYVVTAERNGGTCNFNTRRFCDAFCSERPPCAAAAPKNCVKKWSECRGTGGGSYRIEIVVEPAQNGGLCERRYEFGCDTSTPVDCRKRWGQCSGIGPRSVRREIMVTPAQNGGGCNLRTERGCKPYRAVDCTKQWGGCLGNGPTSERTEIIVTPAQNGGKCQLRTENGCRYEPVDCKKSWGRCRGVGEGSSRKEFIVSAALYGGTCELKTEKGCNNPPQNCRKRWGKCQGEGAASFRDEEVVTEAKNGGNCDIRREFGCNPYKPVDCTKEWGECIGNGPKSERREVEITPARHGGKCRLKKEKGCRTEPVDCEKKWGKCKGIGKNSIRKEEIVKKKMYGGKCELRTQKGCNNQPQDCVKRWGNCVGAGAGSFRDEEIVTEEKHGGTCTPLRREFGCNNPTEPPTTADTPGKQVADLLLSNFLADAADSGGDSSAPKTGPSVGARTLTFPVAARRVGAKAEADEVTGKNCTEYKDGDKILAIGCDEADVFDPAIVAEEKRRKFSLRTGEKQRPKRTRRNSEPQKLPPKPRDVLFMLDSSGSVGPYKFTILKDVCKAIVDSLCGRISLGKYQTRIAMATFNKRQLLSFPFSKTSSAVTIKKQIDDVGFDYTYSFQSCIKDALEYVITDIYLEKFGARDPSYAEGDMFIMTDGCANCDYEDNSKELQRMAYRLKLNKINVYAIGIGIKENCRNVLRVLARGGRCFHFFFLDDWDVDVEHFLARLKNPPQDRCLDRWEFPGINCLDRRP